MYRLLSLFFLSYFLFSCARVSKEEKERLRPIKEEKEPEANLYFKSFNTADGLYSSELGNVFTDRFGLVWISSGKGIFRFDGNSFTPFFDNLEKGIHLSGTCSFLEDEKGVLWVFSGKGFLHFFDRSKEAFIPVKTNLESGWITPRPLILESASETELWLGGYGGIQRFNKETGESEVFKLEEIRSPEWPHEEKVRAEVLQKDKEGNFWIGTRKFGLIKFDPATQKFDYLRFRDEFYFYALDDWCTDIEMDEDGMFWVSDFDRGLIHFDPYTEKIIDFIEPGKDVRPEGNVHIYDLLKEGDHLWLATESHGLILFNTKTRKIEKHFNTSNSSLPFNQVKALERDTQGNYWVIGNQLAVGSPMFYSFETHALSDANLSVYELAKSDKGVLATSQEGLFEYDAHKKTLTKKLDGQTYGIYESPDKEYWVGESRVTKIFSEDFRKVNKSYAYELEIDSLFSRFRMSRRINEDSNGQLWILDNWNRLKVVNPKTNQIQYIFDLVQDPESKRFIQSQCVLDIPETNEVLVGTDLGLARINKDDLSLQWVKGSSVLQESVSYLYKDSSAQIWAVIGGEIFQIDLEKGLANALRFTDRENSDSYNWIVEQPQGVYWIQSSSGIIKYESGKTSIFPNTNFSEGSLIKPSPVAVSGGKIYYGGENGITVFDPSLVVKSSEPPIMNLDWVKVPFKDQNGILKDSTIQAKSLTSLAIKHFQNRAAFKLSGIHYKEPLLNKVRFMLDGYDEDFIEKENFWEVYYTNLEPGNYTFKYQASNSDGVWSEIKEMSLRIYPPWYATWWAYLLYLVLVIATIYLWIRYQVYLKLQKYKATEEVRTSISADLHDDVGSLLAGLSMKSELMAMGIKEVETESLNSISDMARDAMERMRDTVWAIDSRKDKYENLISRMKSFAEQNLPEKGFDFKFETKGIEEQTFINPLIRQNLYLILKEAITNTLKHSDGNQVTVHMEKEGSKLQLKIADNGSKKESSKSDGLGLSNLKARAHKIGGSLRQYYEKGFVVEVNAPLS
ncbi:triple tyrosine motif-containing protein [Jiulongibacter sp. NS-SX5]|uniref:triple tyrosine motif-containing protein n=1 Tax=Jiulongibacter sp. NS-SX5 TaxID=3463854 RepID=UPI004057DA97